MKKRGLFQIQIDRTNLSYWLRWKKHVVVHSYVIYPCHCDHQSEQQNLHWVWSPCRWTQQRQQHVCDMHCNWFLTTLTNKHRTCKKCSNPTIPLGSCTFHTKLDQAVGIMLVHFVHNFCKGSSFLAATFWISLFLHFSVHCLNIRSCEEIKAHLLLMQPRIFLQVFFSSLTLSQRTWFSASQLHPRLPFSPLELLP